MLAAQVRQLLQIRPVMSRRLHPSEDDALEEYAHALTVRNLKLVALAVAVGTVLAWGLDLVIYRDAPEIGRVLVRMRVCNGASGLLLYAALRSAPVARRAIASSVVFAGLNGLILGYSTSALGDLGTPWFHFTYIGCIALLVPVVRLPARAVISLAYAGGLLVGLGVARPLLPPHPMLGTALGFLAFTTASSLVAGHIFYRLLREGLSNTRAREKAALEVAELNRTLEERVREQTQELRMLAAHLETAREDERSRIARDLHDELGQELTALRYALTFLRRRYERDPVSVRANLDEMEQLLGRAATTTRQILSDLRPRILDDLGLDAGVDWLLKRTEERAGLRCRLVASCRKLDLNVETSIAAFRILQEALTNVVRHAQATNVDVEVTIEGDDLRVSVRDDGVGMAEVTRPRQPGKGGMGLIGMRERADALGGALQIDSRLGSGTTILVHLPLGERRASLENAG